MAASRDLAVETGNGYRVAWAHAQGALLLSLDGRLGDAVASGEAAFDVDPAAPDALAHEDLAHALWLAGRLAEAADLLERSAVRRPVLGSRRRAWGAALAARVHTELGQRGRARSNLEKAAATFDDDFLTWSSWLPWSEGWLAFVEGDSPHALGLLDTVAGRLRAIGALGYEPLVLADLATIAADADDRGRCDDAAGRAREVATTTGTELAAWIADLVGARAVLGRGAADEAVEPAVRALAGLDAAGYRLLAADAAELAGRALVDHDRQRAVAQLQRAAEEHEGCGAAWRRDRVLSLLTGLGARGRRAAAEVQGPASLTPREREVAELTARGHTARDVGEVLFIGKRTVETHLANIYAKLGIGSKRELIRRAAEFGLSDRGDGGGSVPDSVSRTEAGDDDRS